MRFVASSHSVRFEKLIVLAEGTDHPGAVVVQIHADGPQCGIQSAMLHAQRICKKIATNFITFCSSVFAYSSRSLGKKAYIALQTR